MKNTDDADVIPRHRPTTELELRFPQARLRLMIWGPRSKQARRALALAIYKRIETLFHDSNATNGDPPQPGSIVHEDQDLMDIMKAWSREVRHRNAQLTETEAQRIGFEIRMTRSEVGWSQAELARRVGIDRTHLSQIERGNHLARRETLTQIRNRLKEGMEEALRLETQQTPQPPKEKG